MELQPNLVSKERSLLVRFFQKSLTHCPIYEMKRLLISSYRKCQSSQNEFDFHFFFAKSLSENYGTKTEFQYLIEPSLLGRDVHIPDKLEPYIRKQTVFT